MSHKYSLCVQGTQSQTLDIKNRPPEFSGRLKAFCLEYLVHTRNTWTLINERQTKNRALIKGFYAYMVRYASLKEARLNINKWFIGKLLLFINDERYLI